MCGISGFIGNGKNADLVRMTDAIAHRGPDGDGYFIDSEGGVYLGHRRLAILDLSGGHQPMANEDESIHVVFNGEIYNHQELREALQEKGYRFKTSHSDTEVLVHGYREWGKDLPLKLNGMFAFAVYDVTNRQVFFARDRFGEKPLYYQLQEDTLLFSSELKALACHERFNETLDNASIQKFFAYGFFPAPSTPFQQTFKLPGGSWMLYDLASRQLQVERYWHFTLNPDDTLVHAREGKLVEELDHLFTQSVKRRMLSDVPLGIFLSGGIDSSAVLASASELVPASTIQTFTIGFNEQSFDESQYAKQMALHYGTEHHEKVLDIETAKEILPNVLSALAEPIGDSSILPTYLLCEFARERVTVALSGDGGDELFAGYDPFKALPTSSMYSQWVPPLVHQQLRALAERLPISSKNMSLDFKIRRALMGVSYPPSMWNPAWLSPVEPNLMPRLFDAPLPAEKLYEEAIANWDQDPSLDLVDRTMGFYTNFYLQDNILKKVDLAAMMVSLESRAIFLDNDLVAFCERLPNQWKYRQGRGKYILRKMLESKLPAEILNRPKKGFGIPLAKWLRGIDTPDWFEPIEGLNRDWIEACWQQHRARKADYRLAIWGWLSLQHFLKSIKCYRSTIQSEKNGSDTVLLQV